jgi:transposase
LTGWTGRSASGPGPRVKVLTQLPGVGPCTALVILAEAGDISRFASARKLASWAGLTPTVRGSDRVAHYGHIWKGRLGMAALGAVRGGADRQALPAVRARLPAHRQPAREKIATTAVARKLATRAWHLLTDAGHAAAPPPATPPTAAR